MNLTGSPDYGARIRIVGDAGGGCSSDPFRQFNTVAFQGPLVNSVGLESGASYLHGCFASALDLSIAKHPAAGWAQYSSPRRSIQGAECRRDHGPERDPHHVQPERSGHERCAGIRSGHRPLEQRGQPAAKRIGEPRSFEAEERRLWCRDWLPSATQRPTAGQILVLGGLALRARRIPVSQVFSVPSARHPRSTRESSDHPHHTRTRKAAARHRTMTRTASVPLRNPYRSFRPL